MTTRIKAAVLIGAVLSVVVTVADAASLKGNGATPPTKAGTKCGTESCDPLPYKCGTGRLSTLCVLPKPYTPPAPPHRPRPPCDTHGGTRVCQ
jgi:hypothetical protein